MALTGVQDLSVITDQLLQIIRTALTAAAPGFNFTVSGSMPESVRGDGDCQVSFYLYQVGIDRNVRNTPVTGSQLSRRRPLGLELYYLLTTFAAKEYVQEQHAFTIAMRALQDTPFLRMGAPIEEMTVTLEFEGIDKLGFLWQAISAPFRLTAVYKVAVAFLAPTDATPPPAPKPTAFTLSAEPGALPFGEAPVLLGSLARITYLTPDSTPANLKTASFDLTPATAAAGQEAVLLGGNLSGLEASRVFLLDADGTNERDITAWKAAGASLHTPSRIVLQLPATVGAAPANTPAAGVYQIRVGGPGASRSNATALSIAAAMPGVTNPPILTPAAGLFTLTGAGFVSGQTEVLLETVALDETGGAPGAGQFQIAGGSVSFRAPAILPPGRYGVRVRVNGVESPPAWWVVL